MVKELKAEYSDKANFIHIEVYDNPDEIEGDLNNAIVSPVLAEWGLPSEPWTFIVDEDGLIQAKFESFATREELETALTAVLP
jgi:peroxiredoxin